ncbi:hypothetical protein DL98DRAFT_564159 [Cadophora sp. DSE1049]|nr:hypothetical protein DL98DRAFT_564159 [Cadophora sp. DSE1049]
MDETNDSRLEGTEPAPAAKLCKGKAGYGKIQFCGEQARRDGLQYFWVDTCCIDKSNAVEFQEAINSMFRWYRDATKCYVYLPDLITPASVDFFLKEGELLGNKASLERHICEAASRKTFRQEDKAYSLLGIFDVNISLIYSERKDKAINRLREEINKASKRFKREDFSVSFSLSNVSDIEHFVAKKTELIEIHQALSGNSSRRVVALHGLGGIGKTQLAATYTKRHKDSYSAIFWLNIKDEDSLKQSFVKVAKQISREHPSALQLRNVGTNKGLNEVINTVKAWLSRPNNTRWLMIFDNYDNPKLPRNSDRAAVDIRKFLPKSYQGSVIITTRSSQVKNGHPIQIRKLGDVRDSLKILSNVSRREGLRSNPDTIMLARELDGLPLALATAGAYLDQVASWVQLQESSPELDSYEDRTLYSTWQISFDHVKQQSAYFDSQDLWLKLLQHSDSNDPDWVRELTNDELSFHGAMRVLSDHGLVEVEKSSLELVESQGYSIHGCVHSWTVHVLNQEWNYDLARVALKSVALHIPGKQANRPWLTQRRLLQHATRCSHIILNGLHTSTLDTVHNLGNIYADQGKLVEAEQMYQRALQGKEKAWVNNLANLYADQGKLVEAEQMYQRALQGKEKAWGQDHTSTLDAVNNLATLYADQGKLVEAERMYQRALQGKKKA